MDGLPETSEVKEESPETEKSKKFLLVDYIKLTDWKTGKPIHLRRKETVITEVDEIVATKKYSVRTRVKTKDNLYLVTESAHQILSL